MLYPFKFEPILKKAVWGGLRLKQLLNKTKAGAGFGESWEISGVQGSLSVVSNGLLKGNNIQELIEIYMGDLVGDNVYLKFGHEFPLLVKFIDASDDLSIQVHPGDEYARENHNAYGKTEMWYVIHADEGSTLISGFKKKVSREEIAARIVNNTITDILNRQRVKTGDVFFIPSGRIHSIGKGILLAEVQQTSDITYRVYDWNRKDLKGNSRELHITHALDVLDYDIPVSFRTDYSVVPELSTMLSHCTYFHVNVLEFESSVDKDYQLLDSFVILMCLEGEFVIEYEGESEGIRVVQGETILIPAIIKHLYFIPTEKSRLLEIYIP